MKEKEDNLEIIEGDGSGIDISPVSYYIVPIKPKNGKNKRLIIPEEKKLKNKEKKKKK